MAGEEFFWRGNSGKLRRFRSDPRLDDIYNCSRTAATRNTQKISGRNFHWTLYLSGDVSDIFGPTSREAHGPTGSSEIVNENWKRYWPVRCKGYWPGQIDHFSRHIQSRSPGLRETAKSTKFVRIVMAAQGVSVKFTPNRV